MKIWQANIGNYFGPTSFGSILCAQLPISGTIAAISPLLVGMVFEADGIYTAALISFAARSFLTAHLLNFPNPPASGDVLRDLPMVIASEIP